MRPCTTWRGCWWPARIRRFLARRLMILASEDIGMADPTALQTAVAAAQTVALIGMPEAQLTLAHATVHLATAPKSNAVTNALGAAMNDIRAGKAGLCRRICATPLLGAAKLGNAQGYRYPHDDPDGVVPQQYPPDDVVGVDYYKPTGHGMEREIAGASREAAGDHSPQALSHAEQTQNRTIRALSCAILVVCSRPAARSRMRAASRVPSRSAGCRSW